MSGHAHTPIRETEEEDHLDLAEPLVQQAMASLGYEEQDLSRRPEWQVREETLVPPEFLSEKEYYL